MLFRSAKSLAKPTDSIQQMEDNQDTNTITDDDQDDYMMMYMDAGMRDAPVIALNIFFTPRNNLQLLLCCNLLCTNPQESYEKTDASPINADILVVLYPKYACWLWRRGEDSYF